jgi:hypothetical protein
MPRPMQHPRPDPCGTVYNVGCGALLPLSTSGKHVPVTAGAQVRLRPGREAAQRGRGKGQSAGPRSRPVGRWLGQSAA